jgi:hypothetical protein
MKHTPELLRSMARVQQELWKAALATRSDPLSAEVRHFSRWAFAVARQAGEMGLEDVAREALGIAAQSARSHFRDRAEVSVYRAVVAVAGARLTGRAAGMIDALRGQRRRAGTLRLARHARRPS